MKTKFFNKNSLASEELFSEVRYLLKNILWGATFVFLGLILLANVFWPRVAWLNFLFFFNIFHWGFLFVFLTLLIFSSLKFFSRYQIWQDFALIGSFVSIISLGLFFSGGLESPLYFFLIFSVVFSGMLFSFWLAVTISFFVIATFVASVLLEYFGLVPHIFTPFWERTEIFFFGYRLLVYSALVLLIGIVSGYFAQLLRNKNKDLLGAFEELKEKEAQLIQSEKMASVGVLASGISHELKNPLTSILGFADLALRRIKEKSGDEQLNELISEIYLSSRHCREIIQNLLDFARVPDKEEHFEKVNLVPTLKNATRIIKHQLDIQNIIVKENFPSEEIFASGLANQLEQVFLNILINSKDALPGGGEIEITLAETPSDVKIVFKDTGSGMTQAVISRAFEPFFTTKEKDKGVGLGLAVSYGIILKHHGEIKIKSAVNQGTEVIISLPKFKQETKG